MVKSGTMFLLWLIVILLGSRFGQVEGVMTTRVLQYIQKLTAKFEEDKGQFYHTLFAPPMPAFDEVDVIEDDFHQPLILLWNPNITHRMLVENRLQKCLNCGSPYSMGYWNDGSSSSRQPRILHAIDNIVILVSAVYICENRHTILAHDEVILSCFPMKAAIPFVLLHRTGFTSDLVEMCTSLVRSGMNFYNIESLIVERRWETYSRQRSHFHLHRQTMQQTINSDGDFWTSSLSNCPSNNILAKCFLARFLDDEKLYLSEMESITVGSSISFDHTFKVAANIGYYREDKVWVPQYDSLFIVMNAEGRVLTWQLTKGTSFEQVRTILEDLNNRAQGQGQQIKNVYIDECCKLRKKVESVFGPSTAVKLDLFHAVQRITRTFHKRHSLFHQCVLKLRTVFRQDGDTGESRISSTPSPEVILKNIDAFNCKWRDATDPEGNRLFTSDSEKAVDNLKVHITEGCLSNIPPGSGTNQNERFHRHIKSFFNKSKIGIFLAYALLTVIIHYHNSQIHSRGKVIVRPIAASPFHGLVTGRSKPIGIVPKTSRGQREDEENGDEHWEIDLTDKQIDMDFIVPVYSNSIEKLRIMRALEHMKLHQLLTQIFSFRPFEVFSSAHSQNLSYASVEEQLLQYGLTISPSSRDGNCFFHSVAKNLLANPDTWEQSLKRIGILTYTPENLQTQLREAFVNEIIGERRQRYEGFITDVISNYEAEAKKFLENGYFASQLGNLMPLAMSNVLQAYILIFRRDGTSPLYITPVLDTQETPIFLVYDPSGPGNYDSAILYTDICTTNADQKLPKPTKCSCGVNKKGAGTQTSCVFQPHYETRCMCYKLGQACTSLCRCKNCANPNGHRREGAVGGKRKRRIHALQKDIPKSKKFALDRGESMSAAIWSDFESIVLSEIVSSFAEPQQDATILRLYNDVVYYSTAPFCIFFLPDNVTFREKNYAQLHAKLQHVTPSRQLA